MRTTDRHRSCDTAMDLAATRSKWWRLAFGLLLASAALLEPAAARQPHGGTALAYVGSYTPNGTGIALLRLDEATGHLTLLKTFPAVNPSFLAIDPQRQHLYAVNEISNFLGGTTGAVSAFSIDPNSGDLTLLNQVSSGGAGPAHLSVDPSGRFVLVANYGGGNVAVLPILPTGALGSASDVQSDVNACLPACAVGPTKAASAPPGSFAVSGHDAPHAAMIQTDPAGQFVLVNDIGLDRTIVWAFDRVNGKLLAPSTVPSSAGAGPRHFAFHPDGSHVYSINEEASTIAVMAYDAGSGSLTPVQEISTLPRDFAGTSFASEVAVSHDGRFVYAANRLSDSVMSFAVKADGTLVRQRDAWTHGDYPRQFSLDPSGRFMLVGNQRSDNLTSYRVEAGELTFTGTYAGIASPACILFVTLP